MQWRVTELEKEVRRLRADVVALETSVWKLRTSVSNRSYFAVYIVVNAVLFGALARGFGLI